MKLDVNESSEKRKSKQLFPTPASPHHHLSSSHCLTSSHCLRVNRHARRVRKHHKPTAVADQQQLYEVVVVLPPRGHSSPRARCRLSLPEHRHCLPRSMPSCERCCRAVLPGPR